MIGNWEISDLSRPARYIVYAKAYLQASISVCGDMAKHKSQQTWPDACVTMLLASHSVELFLKGAILGRDAKRELKTHNLAELKRIYDALFPEEKFGWEIPFRTEYLGFSAEEAAALEKKQPLPSILYRYPFDREDGQWAGIHGFEPEGFLRVLSALNEDYARLVKHLDAI